MDIKAVMQRQYGPMPVWAWTALAASFIAGIVLFRKRMAPNPGATAGTGQSAGSPVGEFNSGQSTTTTDPTTGNQVTTQYNASGPLTGFPGYITNQAGAMPYSGGDVYVNYPNQPPAQQTTTSGDVNKRTVLSPDFNEVGWDAKAKQNPWTIAVAMPGETWKDITARIYGFAGNYASIKDPAAKSRVDAVADYIRGKNKNYTGEVPDGSGPTPYSAVVYR